MQSAAKLVVPILLVVLPSPSSGDAGDWETVLDGPITVKTREVPDSDVREIWAEGEIDAPAREVQAALMDAEAFTRFMKHIAESRYVGEAEPDGSRFVYTLLDLPIVARRDYVLQVFLDQDLAADGTGEFRNHWVAVPERVPERANVVRVKVNNGSWHVTPRGEKAEKAYAVYRFSIDPGGSIPWFAAEIGNKRGVTGTFRCVEWEARRRAAEREQAEQAEPVQTEQASPEQPAEP